MKRIISFIVLMLFIITNNPIYSRSYVPRRSLTSSSQVVVGMKYDRVIQLLGQPYKKEKIVKNNIEYDVQYFPRGNSVYKTRHIDKNFTPLVFYQGELKGWGWTYFNAFFEVKKGFAVKKVRWNRTNQRHAAKEIPVLNNKKPQNNANDEVQSKKVEQALQNFLQENPAEKQQTSTASTPSQQVSPQAPAAPVSAEPVKEQKSLPAPVIQQREQASQAASPAAPVTAEPVKQQANASAPAVKQEAQMSQAAAPAAPVSAEPVKEQNTPKPVILQQQAQVAPQVSVLTPVLSEPVNQPIGLSAPVMLQQAEAKPQLAALINSVPAEPVKQDLPQSIKNIETVELKKPEAKKEDVPVIQILSNNVKEKKEIEVRVLNSQEGQNISVNKDVKIDAKVNTNACTFKITRQDGNKIETQVELNITLCN